MLLILQQASRVFNPGAWRPQAPDFFPVRPTMKHLVDSSFNPGQFQAAAFIQPQQQDQPSRVVSRYHIFRDAFFIAPPQPIVPSWVGTLLDPIRKQFVFSSLLPEFFSPVFTPVIFTPLVQQVGAELPQVKKVFSSAIYHTYGDPPPPRAPFVSQQTFDLPQAKKVFFSALYDNYGDFPLAAVVQPPFDIKMLPFSYQSRDVPPRKPFLTESITQQYGDVPIFPNLPAVVFVRVGNFALTSTVNAAAQSASVVGSQGLSSQTTNATVVSSTTTTTSGVGTSSTTSGTVTSEKLV